MVTFADLQKLRRELEQLVVRTVSQIFGATLTSQSSSLGESDAVEKADGAQDPDGKKGQRPTVRSQPFGFSSRPPNGLRTFWVKIGSSNVIVLGILPQQKYGPQNDLDVGEAAIYNAIVGCQALFDKNGNVKLGSGTPQGGTQGDVVLNGGSLKVARVTDPLAVGTLTGQAGPYPVQFTYTPTINSSGTDTPGAPSVGASVSLAGIVSNSGGAAHVKS